MVKFKIKIGDGVFAALGQFPEYVLSGFYDTIKGPVKINNSDVFSLDTRSCINEHEQKMNAVFNTDESFNNFEHKEKNEHKTKEVLNNDNIIKNISFDQTEILWNIMQLYNNGQAFDCDMTASELKFYEGRGRGSKYNIPLPKLLFDVYPQDERITKIDKWGTLPLKDNSIHSIVIDLPFVISPANAPSAVSNKEGASLIAKRFAAYYPVDNLFLSYYNWIYEAYRVLDEGGICVFKDQNVISGGIYHSSEEFSFMAAQKVGFKMIDKITLEAKARLISNARYKDGQKHSRSFTSQFYVFKKESKRKSKDFNYFELLERCEKERTEKFVNVIEK